MKCADLCEALGALQARPGEPHKLIDERGTVVEVMHTENGVEVKNMLGVPMHFTRDEALDMLAFMQGWVTLEALDPVAYLTRSP